MNNVEGLASYDVCGLFDFVFFPIILIGAYECDLSPSQKNGDKSQRRYLPISLYCHNVLRAAISIHPDQFMGDFPTCDVIYH